MNYSIRFIFLFFGLFFTASYANAILNLYGFENKSDRHVTILKIEPWKSNESYQVGKRSGHYTDIWLPFNPANGDVYNLRITSCLGESCAKIILWDDTRSFLCYRKLLPYESQKQCVYTGGNKDFYGTLYANGDLVFIERSGFGFNRHVKYIIINDFLS